MAAASTTLPLDGRVALVTGGSRGIGREVSSHLAALGARVVVNYASNPAKAEELVAERGVSDPAAVLALFDRAEEAFGSPPHIVVAYAGIMDAKYPALADTAVEDFDATFAVNTRGKLLVCREAARRIPPNSGGRIVTFSSSTVAVLPPGYAASNAAVEAMTRILAKEVAAKGITANVVAPGPVNTELFFAGKDEAFLERVKKTIGRIAETTQIAPVVTFLASEASSWVNGQVIRVNGGVA
ncbi:NADPH-dependent aldehyde reductase-like protein, chloroplastic [Miscanthus floridulus]|uniref:NADPH-dependent aldehyde reductase-like protein, chloroplastic n=1 Tax=Miscanthus floridulus TaxID=154761 RepID=UPI00345B37F8